MLEDSDIVVCGFGLYPGGGGFGLYPGGGGTLKPSDFTAGAEPGSVVSASN